jgi:NADH-quinone oxidoreductase subunit K
MLHPITTTHYLVLSTALLAIGTLGVLMRRNIVIILMSIELILNAVNINLIAFSQSLRNVSGQIFAIFVITVAVAEAAVGLGIVIVVARNRQSLNVERINLLKL